MCFHRKLLLIIVLLSNLNSVFAVGNESIDLACPDFPYFRPKTGPIAVVNCDFHKAYEKRVEQIMRTLGAPGGRAVILNLGGNLVLKYNGKTETIDVTPNAYQDVKVFAHATMAVYLLLFQKNAGQLDPQIKLDLRALEQHVQQAAALIPSINISPKEKETVVQLATLTEDFLQGVLTKGDWTTAEVDAYFQQVKPLIFDTTKIALKLEIDALDKAINPWLADMSPEDQKKIGIVVATAHQARAREASLQYFARKFGQRFGEGASLEDGLVVLEEKFDETSALKLLARHYLDRSAATAIFNEPAKLQSDLLGDAAASLLGSL